MLRVQTRLSDGLEDIIQRVIGCCISVHRALGPGLLEGIYVRAVCVELEFAGIPFEVEKDVPVMYRGRLLCHQKLDIVVAGQLVLEIKAVDRLHPVHEAQTISSLRASKLPVALLINFNVEVLRQGIRRIVL